MPRLRFDRRRFDPKLAAASLAIAFGIVLIGYGVMSAVTGDEVTKLPDAIESIDPRPDAVQVPSQTTIVVDFASGYTGRMVVDGVEYETIDPERGRDPNRDDAPAPGEQVTVEAGARFERGNFTLTFVPGEEVGFDEFAVGNHSVTVYYWKLEDEVDGRPTRESRYHWTFNIV